jgi:hypothetical protein
MFSDIMLVLIGTVGIFGPAIAAIGWMLFAYHQSRAAVFDWATAHQYTIIQCHYRTFRRGPFFTWGSQARAPVYSIVVVDQAGHTHTGWARCGFWKKVEVRWDTRLRYHH